MAALLETGCSVVELVLGDSRAVGPSREGGLIGGMRVGLLADRGEPLPFDLGPPVLAGQTGRLSAFGAIKWEWSVADGPLLLRDELQLFELFELVVNLIAELIRTYLGWEKPMSVSKRSSRTTCG